MTPGLQKLNCLASYLGCHPVGTILGLGQSWPQTRKNLSLQGIVTWGKMANFTDTFCLHPKPDSPPSLPYPDSPFQAPQCRLPNPVFPAQTPQTVHHSKREQEPSDKSQASDRSPVCILDQLLCRRHLHIGWRGPHPVPVRDSGLWCDQLSDDYRLGELLESSLSRAPGSPNSSLAGIQKPLGPVSTQGTLVLEALFECSWSRVGVQLSW